MKPKGSMELQSFQGELTESGMDASDQSAQIPHLLPTEVHVVSEAGPETPMEHVDLGTVFCLIRFFNEKTG